MIEDQSDTANPVSVQGVSIIQSNSKSYDSLCDALLHVLLSENDTIQANKTLSLISIKLLLDNFTIS
jgi:hypothetical protein